jgi:hypothetical protein
LGLTGFQRESTAVLPTLDLAVVFVNVTLRQGEVGVTTSVADGIEIIFDANKSNALTLNVEPTGITGLQVVTRTQADPTH